MRITLVNHTDLQQLLNFTLKCFLSGAMACLIQKIFPAYTDTNVQNSKLKHFKSSELLSQVQPDRHIVNEEMKSESIKDNDHNQSKEQKEHIKKVKIKMALGRIYNNTEVAAMVVKKSQYPSQNQQPYV